MVGGVSMNVWERIRRIGFIGGCGHFYAAHVLPPVGDATRPRVAVALDGYDNDAARRFAQRFAADVTYDTAEAMLDGGELDLVCVGSVPGRLGRFNCLAAERGVPIITEKPPAATWQDLERLLSLHRQRGVTLVTEMPWRVMPPMIAARAAVAAGRVGRVVLVSAQKSYRFNQRPAWYGRRDDYGGTIPWVASHAVDAVAFITGERFARVWGDHANLGMPAYPQMEDHAMLGARLEGGAGVSITADYLNPPKAAAHADEWIRIAGTRGVIRIRAKQAFLTDADAADTPLALADGPDPGHAMLRAALGDVEQPYNTHHALTLTATLLTWRDAADGGQATDVRRRMESLGLW